MRTLLVLAALTTATPAFSAELYDSPASELAGDCSLLVRGHSTYEEAQAAEWCWRTAQDWLIDTKRDPMEDGDPQSVGYQQNDQSAEITECAARLIFEHAQENRSVADILKSEFDNACQPATM